MRNQEWEETWEENWIPLSPEAISLEHQQLTQARQWSQIGYGEPQQWQIYRNGLALMGVIQWLQSQGICSLTLRHHSLKDPVTANLLNAVVGLQIGAYTIALCPQENIHEHQTLTLPRLLLHYQVADFYLGIQLWEETGYVKVVQGLWHEDLMKALENQSWESQNLEIQQGNSGIDSETITVPASLTQDDILLALRCGSFISSKANALPIKSSDLVSESYLENKLSQWQSWSNRTEIFNWQEQLQILTSATLGAKFKQVLNQQIQPPVMQRVNVGQWWNPMLDHISQQLGWIRLSPLNPALRSPHNETTEIMGRLYHQGIDIPHDAQASYQDIQIVTQVIRLYAVVWPAPTVLANSEHNSTWSLLLVLCTMPAAALSIPIEMLVRDGEQNLARQTLQPHDAQTCSYVQVSGSQSESFWVTLTELNHPASTKTLPPFSFETP